jgi:outer membrane receptor protein involved in Fe transport
MRTRTLLLLILLIPSTALFGQKPGVLLGLVRDAATKEPLTGVNIIVNGTTGTVTDIAGKYQYEVSPGDYTIEYRFVGYQSQVRKVSVASAEARILNIDLPLSSTTLNTVVVSAGKFEQKLNEVTVSMDVIKPSLIDNTNATSMDVAIEQVPGVVVLDGQANIRGGSGFSYGAGSRVLLLVDDIPLLASDAADVKWSFLPIENIEQIEVIKGASSALFGSSAMNGVINVRTAYPKSVPETNIQWFTGWYGDTKREELQWWGNKMQQFHGVYFNHKQQIKQWDLVVGGNAFRDEGYKAGANEERYRVNMNTRYRFKKIEGLSAGVNGNLMFTQGGLFLIWENDSSGAYIPQGGLSDSTTTISLYETRRTSIDPYITYVGKNGSTHKLRSRYFKTDNYNNTNQQSFAATYYAEYLYQKKFREFLNVTLGISETYSDIRSELYEDHTANNMAVFAQADLKFWRVNFSVGGRMESNEVDGGNKETIPVVRSGINLEVVKNTNLRASYGQGYRYPSIAERFVQTQVGSIVIYPNDSLKSETGWTAEVGLKQGFRLGGWSGYVDVAYFWSEYQDMLEFTFGIYGPFVPPTFGFGFQSKNIGNTRITGWDIGFVGDGNIGRTPVSIYCGYTYMDPIQLDFDPAEDTLKNSANYNILKYRYKHLFKGDVEVNPGAWMVGMSARYNSFMENIDAVFESDFLPGVKHYRDMHDYGDWVFDLRVGYRVTKQFRVSVITRNLFNHEYMERPADMQPPRNYALQLNIKL